MSFDQGLLSPPASGRTCKTDQPRMNAINEYTSHDIFAPGANPGTDRHQPKFAQHQLRMSPVKQHTSILPSERPPTPPLTSDTRRDDEHAASLLSAAPSSSFLDGDIRENVMRHFRAHHYVSSVTASSLPTCSDDEVNSLLHVSPDAHGGCRNSADSEQEGWSADDDDTAASDEDQARTPHTQCSPVDFQPRLWDAPIRDTPKNPFLAGGPADQGFYGPRGHDARQRARQLPQKERGKITYVFRGQRVTYADPEYDSDDSEEWLDNQHQGTRPPRLQPRLLFPPAPPPAAVRPPPSSGGGGLFAPQLAQKRKLAESRQQDCLSASSRLQHVTSMSQHPDQAARRALLARLDQANWSDEEEQRDNIMQRNVIGDDSDEDHAHVELVRPVKRARHAHTSVDKQDQDEREVAFWLQDISQQRDTVSRTSLVQRMKGR